MRIDPHVHSSGASLCSGVTCEEIIRLKKENGYDGAVLTNHCQPWYYEKSQHKEWVEKFIAEYKSGKEYADKEGFLFMLGIEVSVNEPAYSDWLLYGVTEEFLRESPCLYALTQQELYAYCQKYGVVMVQAHPYRSPIRPGLTEYMDGVEINCQPNDLAKREIVSDLAKTHRLIVTAGTDYHHPSMTYRGGMVIPDTIKCAEDLAAYLKKGETKIFLEDEELCFLNGEQK